MRFGRPIAGSEISRDRFFFRRVKSPDQAAAFTRDAIRDG
jgi:hypothetical protein